MKFKTMPTQELKNLWSEQSDERFPAYRADDSPIHSFYPIDNYIVLLDGENIVGAVGFSKRDGFTLRGGSFSVPKYRKKGLFNTILAEADKLSPPFIAGFSSDAVNNKEWVESNKKKGWNMNPTDEELGEYADNPTVMGFKDFYGNSPTGAKWAVKGLPLSKMWKGDIKMTWQDILKKKKKKSTVNSAGNYTKPTMRKKIFYRIKAGSKGGPAGKISARKMQMVALEYKRKGGGYRD